MELAIAPALSRHDLAEVRRLLEEYQAEIGVDLCFQGFAEELAGLPGAYAPPQGALLLARARALGFCPVGQWAVAAGTVALRPLPFDGNDPPAACEMKRLYVRPGLRAHGLGAQLCRAIVDEARRLGYRRMVLDTLPELTAALALYRALGFVEIAPYYANPIPGTVYLGLDLDAAAV